MFKLSPKYNKRTHETMFLFINIFLAIGLYYYPINSLIFRTIYLITIVFIIKGVFVLVKNNKYLLILLGILILGPIIIICLPDREYDKEEFNKQYVTSLIKYENTKYVRGGENVLGIDCSGLPRRALMDTYTEFGLKTFNGLMLRKSILTWWFDTSARALLEHYKNQTSTILASESINTIDSSKIRAGDFVVTADGMHVLNYIGDDKWIEADPGPQEAKVIIVTVPSKNYWFGVPVVVLRWNI